MKKLYTLILFTVLFSGATKAQLTLTKAANEPIIGDFERKKSYDSTSTLVNSTGSNQTWNFTSLTSNTIAVVTNTYTTPSSVPGYTSSSTFTASTVSRTDGTVSDFFVSNATQFELIGTRLSSSLTITFTNSAIAAIWPITNTYSLTDPISGQIRVSIFGPPSTGPFNGTQTVAATGTGTLQLPNAITLNNCLQLTSRLTGTGSVTIFTATTNMTLTSISYNYYHSSQKFPVLSIAHSTTSIKSGTAAPTNNSTTAITINNDVFAGINEFTLDNSYSVYPNPASGMFNVALSNIKAESVSIEIFNQVGQSIKKENLGNGSNINSTINTSGFNSGVYFVKTTVGNRSSVKKLIIE